MGAAGREYIHFKIEVEEYNGLEQEVRDRMSIKRVEVEDIDYSHCETWQKLKSESIKAYKSLKDHEYNLRHKSNK
jgi:hypothetical protein